MYRRIDLGTYVATPVWYGCNNDCVICMLAGLKHELPVIDFAHFQTLIRDIIDDGRYRNLILSGAEVTTYEPLEEYVRFTSSLHWFGTIQVQTNGRRLRDREYLRRLTDAGVNEFFISLHGPEATHDSISRVPGSHAETMAAIANLEDLRVKYITNTVLSRMNYRDLVPFFSRLAETEVSEIYLWNYFPMEKGDTRDLVVKLGDLRALLPEVAAVLGKRGKPLVLKAFPDCLRVAEPVFVDSAFPITLIPDTFWKRLRESGFGSCVHREGCGRKRCWGLSRAYIQKYGDEREALSPI